VSLGRTGDEPRCAVRLGAAGEVAVGRVSLGAGLRRVTGGRTSLPELGRLARVAHGRLARFPDGSFAERPARVPTRPTVGLVVEPLNGVGTAIDAPSRRSLRFLGAMPLGEGVVLPWDAVDVDAFGRALELEVAEVRLEAWKGPAFAHVLGACGGRAPLLLNLCASLFLNLCAPLLLNLSAPRLLILRAPLLRNRCAQFQHQGPVVGAENFG